jgi:Lon protease-like protein
MNQQSREKKILLRKIIFFFCQLFSSSFADYGTLLYIRGFVYTQDGRSIVDTIGQRRFRVLERGTRDGYNTAKVELIRDHPIEQHEFDGLFKFQKEIK